MSALSVVNTNELSHVVERMRIVVPSAIMESERTLAERDQILADAHAEAERVLQEARQRVTEMLTEQAIVAAARAEAERLIEDGRLMAKRRAEEADLYAMQVLEDLAQKLQTVTRQVDNGVQIMRNNRLSQEQTGDEATQAIYNEDGLMVDERR